MEHSSESPKKGKASSLSPQGSSSFLSRAVRNFLFSGVGTIASLALMFLFAGLTIRYLGTARAGFFMALAALTGLEGFIGNLGLGIPTVRRVAALNASGEMATARTIVGSVSTITIGSTLIIVLPIIVFFPTIFGWSRLDSVYHEDAYWATIFTLGSFILIKIFNTWKATYSALERYGLISVFDTVFGLLSGLSAIAVLMVLPTMAAVAGIRFIVLVMRMIPEVHYIRKFLGGIPWPTWAWGEIRPMMSFGGWVYFGGVGELLLSRANSLILTSFMGSAVLPFFEIPQRIYRMVHGILGNQSSFLFPMLASFGNKATAEYKRLEDRLMWIMAITSGAIYTCLAFVGPSLLSLIVNPEFATKATMPLYLACIQGYFAAQAIVPYQSSWAMGFGKPNSLFSLSSGILITVTTLFLILRMGYVGASAAQLWVCIIVVIYIVAVHRLLIPESRPLAWINSFI
jgi:O-antigen/teichoic acid export membrane protein